MRFTAPALALALGLLTVSSVGLSQRPDAAIDPRSMLLVGQARDAASAGRLELANDALETALAVDPRNRAAYGLMADIATRQGLPGKAIRLYRESLTIEPNDVGVAGEPAVVDGVKGEWRVDPTLLEGRFTGRTALLSPLDRLIFDRVRMKEIFEFDYQLEMYKPAAKRTWGYFALPILHGDRLVGKLDAEAKPKAHSLVINAVHEDVAFTGAMRAGVDAEIEDLARMLGLDVDRR